MLYSLVVGAVALLFLGKTDARKTFKSDHFVLVDLEKGGLKWRRGETYCRRKYGTHLATVDSADKQAEMADLMRDNGYTTDKQKAWLGGKDAKNEGVWKWRDKSKFDYTYWNVNEPNGHQNENCLMTWPHANYKWNDGVCSKDTICPVFICNRPCDCDGHGNPCNVPSWSVKKAGLYWAWASPCSGGCSQVELKYGWRFATPEEWQHHPTKEEFMRDLPESEWCAASVFDNKWDHCDEGNQLVRVPDGSYNEQVLVHGCCEGNPPPPPEREECDCNGMGDTCDALSWAVPKGGYYWAWASPCSGGCSQVHLKAGWRYATLEEWRFVPTKNEFMRGLPQSAWCAASFFDPKYDHCDSVNNLVRLPDGGYQEQVLIHGDCEAEDVPEPPVEENPCACNRDGKPCDVLTWAVEKGGLFWAWASPCSGQCSQAELLYGWRYATEEEWQHVPTKEEFYRGLPENEWCAAKVFDPRWDHCDESNRLVRVPDGSYNEQVLVHDKCGGCICSEDTLCKDTPYAHRDPETGLFWAWASPCSGGCSQLVDPLPYGWRRATEEEWHAKSFHLNEEGLKFFGYHLAYNHGNDGQQIKSEHHPETCAANVFDPRYNHCDAINFIQGHATYKDDNGYAETLIVHDFDPAVCAEQPNWDIPIPRMHKKEEDTTETIMS